MEESDKRRVERKRERKISAGPFHGHIKTRGEEGEDVVAGTRNDNHESPSQKPEAHFIPAKPSGFSNEIFENKDKPPKLPKEIADELRKSFLARKARKLRERKKVISRVMKRRMSQRSLFTPDKNLEEKTMAKNGLCVDSSGRKLISGSNVEDTIPTESTSRASLKNQLHNRLDQEIVQIERSYHAFRAEYDRFTLENQDLKNKLLIKDEQTSLLRQQVNHLTSETKSVRAQLTKWQAETKRLREVQNRESYPNNSVLVSEARIGLTKALNDASKLEAKIFDLQTTIEARDRIIDELYDTIERQTKTITEVMTKLRDKETILRLDENEKRKLQDEVEVLIASKNGDDIGKTLRRLERAREKWLSDREQKIEATRVALESEYDRSLERYKSRHRQEQAISKINLNKRKQVEEKQQKASQHVNQQLEYMMELNLELQEKVRKEREEMLVEIEEKNDTIVAYELQLDNLHKQIDILHQSEKVHVFLTEETVSLKSDILDEGNRNDLLKGTQETTSMKSNVLDEDKKNDLLKEEVERLKKRKKKLKKKDIEEPRSYGEKGLIILQEPPTKSERMKSHGKDVAKNLQRTQRKSNKIFNKQVSEKVLELLSDGKTEVKSNLKRIPSKSKEIIYKQVSQKVLDLTSDDRIEENTLQKTFRKPKKHMDQPSGLRKQKTKGKSKESNTKTKNDKTKDYEKSKYVDRKVEKKGDRVRTRKQDKMKKKSTVNTAMSLGDDSMAVLKQLDESSSSESESISRIPRSILFTPIIQ